MGGRRRTNLLPSLFFCFLFLFSFSSGSLPLEQLKTLEEFYEVTLGKEWDYANHWLDGDPCENNWHGVTCSPPPPPPPFKSFSSSSSPPTAGVNESTVISIALSDNNLQRSLPDNMMTLPDLLSFSVPGNSLGGDLPSFSSSLQYLDVAHNKMGQNTGLGSLNTMTQLVHFDISHNRWSGGIDDGVFKGKKDLVQFFVNDNHFHGPIPSSVEDSPCDSLDMSHNSFNGTLPIIKMREIFLSNNKISGTIPDEFASDDIETLDLSGNQLEGILPDGFNQLISLSISDNGFYGPFPNSQLPLMPALEEFFAENNQFTGYPDNRICNIKDFDVSGNPFNCKKKDKFAHCCDVKTCGNCLVVIGRRIKWLMLFLVLLFTFVCFGFFTWLRAGRMIGDVDSTHSSEPQQQEEQSFDIIGYFKNLMPGSTEPREGEESEVLMNNDQRFSAHEL